MLRGNRRKVTPGCRRPPRTPHMRAWGLPHTTEREQSMGLVARLAELGFKIQEHRADGAAWGCGCSVLRGLP